MSPRRPKNVVAVTPGGEVKLDHVLGWLAMYTVPDAPVKHGTLRRVWGQFDLDASVLPPERAEVNVFQTACRSVATTRNRSQHAGVEVKVDEIVEDHERSVYQITRMIRDRTNMLIDHPKALRVTFDKKASTIEAESLEQEHADALAGIEQQIRDYYEANTSSVPGQTIRNAVRKYMADLGATNVRKKAGGVYFVPKAARNIDTLENLAECLDQLYKGEAELYTIPLVDDGSKRDMVERHFTSNVAEQVEEQVAKIAAVLKRDSGTIRSDMFNNTIAKRKQLGDLHAQYKELLSGQLDGVKDSLSILDAQIESLMDRYNESVPA